MNNKLGLLWVGIIGLLVIFAMQIHPSQAASISATSTPAVALRAPRALTPTQTGVPTTSNPTSNGTKGGRIYSNTSFENSDFACFTLPSSGIY